MEPEKSSWWHRHGWTVAILFTAFGIAFAIRTIFAGPIITEFGPLYTYGGGSDSYYHSRVMSYIIANHTNLIHDPLLRYPIGATNPREPLFDWMNAILGIVFAPFFGGNANVAGAWFLDLQAPLWAALTVFPTYLIGREVGGRRVGLIAAIISPFLVASINESIFGYANYLSFYTFIILIGLYAYMRAIKAVGSRRWVASYRSPRGIGAGLRNFLRYERTAVKWGVFAGVSFGALALAWQGYTYLIAIIVVFLLVTMIVERIRRVDSFGLYVITWIVAVIGFPLAMPYYLVQGEFANWFDLPLVLFFGTLLLLLPFLLMRDLPWVVSIPTLVGIVIAGLIALAFVAPVYFTNLVTGQGYFVKTLVYSTVAEAQAPSIDQLIISYGVITFFLAFAGVGLVIWELIRGKFQRWMMLFLVFGIISMYLPFSASKFLLLGSPAFALLPALAIKRLWDVGRYSEMRQTMTSLTEERRSRWTAFRRSFKPRHVLVIIVVVGLIVPNIWYSVDAGIPSNDKTQFSTQIYNSLPSWLQPSAASSSGFYLGAAGSSLDTPNLYDSAGYNWLATQDVNLPEPQRPAVISWWDYGFQTIDQGQHPAVADNFQNGIDPGGQFLLAQNESIAIGVLVATLLVSEAGAGKLPTAMNQLLAKDGLSPVVINSFILNTTTDYYQVVNNPQVFLPVNPSTLTALNAEYMVISYYVAQSLSLTGVSKVYNDIQAYTGWSIAYALSDTRLFPFSGQDTGIYYAPADLTGRVLDSGGNPSTYFNVTVLGSDGNYYDEGQVPADVTPEQYYINYFAPFYNSMIYHIYIGYNGTDIGLANGIPGLEGDAASDPIEPAWMLQHFEVVYKTAYVCPAGVATGSASASCQATNVPQAAALAAQTGGTVDTTANSYFTGGESILEYYAGQPLIGTVTLPNGAPVAGATVTVYDSWGIPHMSVTTSSTGYYSVILPPGDDTVNVTTGTFQGLQQAGSVVLDSMKISVSAAQGFGFNTPRMVQSVVIKPTSLPGFVYWNTANSTYDPSVDTLVAGAQVNFWGSANQTKYTATTDASGSFNITNMAPGLYNYSVVVDGSNFTQAAVTVCPGCYNGLAINGTALTPAIFQGTVTLPGGTPVNDSTVSAVSSTGRVSTTTSNATGVFVLGNLGPGNYTITAVGPYTGYRSLGTVAVVTSQGETGNLTLVIVPSVSFSLSLTANGRLLSDFPVRFIPIPTLSTNVSATSVYSEAQSDATILTTGSNGQLAANLPAGNYSVYSVGYVGNRLYSGIASIHVPASLAFTNPTTLALAPAVSLTGTVATVDPENATTVVIAYDSAGNQVTTTTTTNGTYGFLLPAGTYSVLALQGSTSDTQTYAGLTSVQLKFASSLSITPVVATAAAFEVGSPINATGELYPASYAMVNVSIGPGGPTVTAFADANGNVTVLVPSSLANDATYCVRSQAFGFGTTQQCGIPASGLAVLQQFPVPLTPVPVTLTVYGVPSGVPITVNFTSASPTAQTITLTGGPVFHFTLAPGIYGVGARATIGNTTVYLPPQLLSTQIDVGTTQTTLSLLLIVQVKVTGTLVLPSGVAASAVTVDLNSPLVNTSINGTQFESGFYATPGTYSLYATAQGNNQYYANISLVRIGTNAQVTKPVELSQRANIVNGTLEAPGGATIQTNSTVEFLAPDLANVTGGVTNGLFSVLLPASTTFGVQFQATVLVPGLNGSVYTTYTAPPGASCTVPATTNGVCTIVTVATVNTVWFNGTLQNAAGSLPVAGTIWLTGPYPSTAVTVVSTSTGTFAISLAPGTYTLYAAGGGPSSPLAAIGQVIVIPGVGTYAIPLQSAWTATITPTAALGAVGGTVTVTVRSAAGGAGAVFPNVPIGQPYSIALPIGAYSITATAVTHPYGVATNASATQAVSIVRGNVAVNLPLVPVFSYHVAATLVGPAISTIPAGATTTFNFRVTSTSSGPLTLHFVGSPAYWNFTFSPSTVTLGVSGSTSTAAVQVAIRVPAGELVAHPGVVIEAVATNGTVIATITPTPVVKIVPVYGLGLGASTPTETALTRVLIPFYVVNSGNINETVTLNVVDGTRLTSYGWDYNITSDGQIISGSFSLAASQNSTYFLNLTAAGTVFIRPGYVTVSAVTSLSNSSLQRVATLSVPVGTLGVNTTTFTLTGPGVTNAPSTLPSWLVPVLVFVPAIALLVLVGVFRWNRSRRWDRR